ncbi:MAG: hypothetical protein H8E44_15345 [Planctomycetes bacterium]|nr:hypothetical protein [Planctomycetota bacterium]MBL7039499.1 hypothetical protein [Pirellulaceae bacterium]
MKGIETDARDDIHVLRTELQDQAVEATGNGALVTVAPPALIDPHALEVWETEGGAIG